MENITIFEELDQVTIDEEDFDEMINSESNNYYMPIEVKYPLGAEEDQDHGWKITFQIDSSGYVNFTIELKINVVMRGLIIQLFYSAVRSIKTWGVEWEDEKTRYSWFCKAFEVIQKNFKERHLARYQAFYTPPSVNPKGAKPGRASLRAPLGSVTGFPFGPLSG
jgi:hypothetical protein